MKNYLFSVMTIFAVSATSALATTSIDTKNAKSVDISGFECAQNVMNLLPLIGRGNDFPHFVMRDIEMSLQKQSKGATLVQAHCTGQVQQQLHVKEIPVDGQQQQVLSTLEVIIPLSIVVEDGPQTTRLNIEQVYITTNLDTQDARKTVQTFRVLEQEIL